MESWAQPPAVLSRTVAYLGNIVQLEQAKQEARRLIDALPQRAQIDTAHIEPWLEAVCTREPQRLLWHVARLGGIGGSEIGELLCAEQGDFTFEDPAELVAQKLLRLPPSRPTGHTRRGVGLEDTIRQAFYKKYGAQRERTLLEALAKGGPPPDHPWCRGFLDDIVKLPNDGQLHLPDYKAPTAARCREILEKGVPLTYRSQLHLYRYLVAAKTGIEIPGLLLVPFDYEQWEPFALPVAYERALERDVLEVGEMYWREYVMRGVLPQRRVGSPARIVAAGDVPASWTAELQELAITKSICDAGYAHFNRRKSALAATIQTEVPEEQLRCEYYGMSVTLRTRMQLRLVPAVERLRRAGVPMTSLLADGYEKYDPDKVRRALEAHLPQEAPRYLEPARDVQITKTRMQSGDQGRYSRTLQDFGRQWFGHMLEQIPEPGNEQRTSANSRLTDSPRSTDNGTNESVMPSEGGIDERVRRSRPAGEPEL